MTGQILNLLLIFLPAAVSLFILLWARYMCTWEWTNGCKTAHYPALGHIILITTLSLIPIVGIVINVVLIGLYIFERIVGQLKLRHNKFNQIFFDK